MALINEIDYISKDLYENLKGGKDYIIIEDAEDNFSRIQSLFHNGYPVQFSGLIHCLTRYLSFPIIEFENKTEDFYNQIILRIGNVFSIFDIYKDGNEYVVDLLHKELMETLDLFTHEGLLLNELSLDIFTSRVHSKEEKAQELYAHDGSLNTFKEYHVIEFKLMPSNAIMPSFHTITKDIEKVEEQKNRYLILEELGIVDYLIENWQIKKEEIRRNENAPQKLFFDIFNFDKFETFRTYPRDFKNKPEFYSDNQKKKVKQYLQNHDITRMKKKG